MMHGTRGAPESAMRGAASIWARLRAHRAFPLVAACLSFAVGAVLALVAPS